MSGRKFNRGFYCTRPDGCQVRFKNKRQLDRHDCQRSEEVGEGFHRPVAKMLATPKTSGPRFICCGTAIKITCIIRNDIWAENVTLKESALFNICLGWKGESPKW
jgi:hypothetical protein